MKELSSIQVMAALSLAKNPLISKVEVEVEHNGLSRITIKSVVNAEWDGVDGVDMAVSLALDEVFPGLEYSGKPVIYPNLVDDTDTELYFIHWNGEQLINLHMKKATRQRDLEETIHQQYTPNQLSLVEILEREA